MTTIVVIDELDIVRAGEAIGRDATPAKGETMRVVRRAGSDAVTVIYASSIVTLASRRIDVALRRLLECMHELDDEERRVVMSLASDAIDESVAVIERCVYAVESYLTREDAYDERINNHHHLDV